MSKVVTVGGLELHAVGGKKLMDTSVELSRCPMCGYVAGFRSDGYGWLRAECSNTSCGIATPYHYKDRESATAAWNRRAPVNGSGSA